MRALPARANHRQSKTAADAFFLTVFDRRSDCRKAPAVRRRVTANVWADFYIAFHSHGGFGAGRFVSLPGGTFEPSPGCGALFLLRGAEPACKKQTAAPAPPRLYLPQAAARLRSHPPTEVTPGLRPRPLTGALNHRLHSYECRFFQIKMPQGRTQGPEAKREDRAGGLKNWDQRYLKVICPQGKT